MRDDDVNDPYAACPRCAEAERAQRVQGSYDGCGSAESVAAELHVEYRWWGVTTDKTLPSRASKRIVTHPRFRDEVGPRMGSWNHAQALPIYEG